MLCPIKQESSQGCEIRTRLTTALVVTPDSDFHYLAAVRCQAGPDNLEKDILRAAKVNYLNTIILIYKEVARCPLTNGYALVTTDEVDQLADRLMRPLPQELLQQLETPEPAERCVIYTLTVQCTIVSCEHSSVELIKQIIFGTDTRITVGEYDRGLSTHASKKVRR